MAENVASALMWAEFLRRLPARAEGALRGAGIINPASLASASALAFFEQSNIGSETVRAIEAAALRAGLTVGWEVSAHARKKVADEEVGSLLCDLTIMCGEDAVRAAVSEWLAWVEVRAKV